MTHQYTEDEWEAHYKRMENFMKPTRKSLDDATAEEWNAASKVGTKSDRNLPLDQTPEYKFAAAAIRPQGERSLRYNSGKPDYSLIPIAAMQEAAKVLEYGASKYERDNWRRPTHWSVSFACLQRHLAAWQSGEDNDPESGRNHLGHAMCNILQMLDMLENHPEELER